MSRPKNKEELLKASQENFENLIKLVDQLPAETRLESGALADGQSRTYWPIYTLGKRCF